VKLKPGVKGDATFSADGRCRYHLERTWEPEKGYVLYVGLNPSKAGKDTDDMTVVKGQGFARRVFGAGGTLHGNAFPYIATNPVDLVESTTRDLEENDKWLLSMARRARVVVYAWGSFGGSLYDARFRKVESLLLPFSPRCFGTTKDGCPRHISRIGYDTPHGPWRVP
jgi:hypothetical protein